MKRGIFFLLSFRLVIIIGRPGRADVLKMEKAFAASYDIVTKEDVSLDVSELWPGDVLIITDKRGFHKNLSNHIITSAQATQLFMHLGHSNAVHAALVVLDENGAKKIVDLTGSGLHIKAMEQCYPYTMYCHRCCDREFSETAAKVGFQAFQKHGNDAKEPMVEVDENTKIEEEEHGHGGATGGSFHVSTSSSSLAQEKKEMSYSVTTTVQTIAFPYLFMPWHFRSSHHSLRSFCSKFVIETLQIAQHQILQKRKDKKEQEALIDMFYLEKTSSVKRLDHYLTKSADFRTYVVPPKGSDVLFNFLKLELLEKLKKSNKKTANALENHLKRVEKIRSRNSSLKSFDGCLVILKSIATEESDILEHAEKFGFEEDMLNDPRIAMINERYNIVEEIDLEVSVNRIAKEMEETSITI